MNLLSVRLESLQEITDYNTALIKQLGIGRGNQESTDKYEEPSHEDNIDVHAGSLSKQQLLLEPLNSSQSTQSTKIFQKVSAQKISLSKVIKTLFEQVIFWKQIQ